MGGLKCSLRSTEVYTRSNFNNNICRRFSATGEKLKIDWNGPLHQCISDKWWSPKNVTQSLLWHVAQSDEATPGSWLPVLITPVQFSQMERIYEVFPDAITTMNPLWIWWGDTWYLRPHVCLSWFRCESGEEFWRCEHTLKRWTLSHAARCTEKLWKSKSV